MSKHVLIAIGVMALALRGCKKESSNTDKTGYPGPTAAGHLPAAPSAPSEPSHGSQAATETTGKVLETMDSGGYTYAKVAVGAEETWVAGPVTTVAVGDTVLLSDGTVMHDFRSNTLDRTFDQIVFVAALPVQGATGSSDGTSAGHTKPPAATGAVEGTIAKAKGGHTVGEVFAKQAELSGKSVIVRGKVVKYNGGIMGRNWLHIQDGSGAPGTNDLTVTSSSTANVGDVVVVQGTLALNQDFGGGYIYDVIVEGATITTE